MGTYKQTIVSCMSHVCMQDKSLYVLIKPDDLRTTQVLGTLLTLGGHKTVYLACMHDDIIVQIRVSSLTRSTVAHVILMY